MSALRQVARLIGGLPADIPANPEALRRALNVMAPTSAGMSKRRWANVRALLTAALELTGARIVRRRRIVGLTPSWFALRNQIRDRYARARLSRFFTYTSAKGVEPDQVNDGTVADFAEALKRNSLLERQMNIIRDLCREWNRCAESIRGWPPTRLTVPNRRRDYSLPVSAYPPSFAADLDAYLDHQARSDLFSGTGRGAAQDRIQPQRPTHCRAAGRRLEREHAERQSRSRHGRPEQRDVCRTSRLEPVELRQGSGDGKAAIARQRERRGHIGRSA